jgi:hypothetical protein
VSARLPLFEIAAVLFAVGVVSGTLLDPVPPRVQATRAGYRVLESDFHAHTRFSDGLLGAFDLVLQGKRRGLDVLAVTEHNNTVPGRLGRWFSPFIGGPTILVGEEVTTNKYHIHGIGLTRRLDASLPLDQVLDEIHRQGAVAIAAHPVKRFWPSLVPARARFDGAEVMHPMAYGSRSGAWSWEQMRDYYLDARRAGQPLTAIGSSDYHGFSILGICRTLVFARGDDERSVLDALKAGRTVVYDLEGKAYGDEELIRALEREPYVMRPQDYGYAGSGVLDRVGRTLGWLGLVGLLLFRREKKGGERA